MGIPTYWSTDTGLKELIKTTGTTCDYIERKLPADSYIKNSVVFTKQLANDTIGFLDSQTPQTSIGTC